MTHTIRTLYLQVDRERAAAVKRLMRRPPVSVAGVIQQVAADGGAWLSELAERRDLTVDDVLTLVDLIGNDTTANINALASVGALTSRQSIAAGIAAGASVAVMVGHDHGERHAYRQILELVNADLADGHRDDGTVEATAAVDQTLTELRNILEDRAK